MAESGNPALLHDQKDRQKDVLTVAGIFVIGLSQEDHAKDRIEALRRVRDANARYDKLAGNVLSAGCFVAALAF
jgi:hypothetical protein